ncbi:MAG TPA: hypothetical protein PKA41_06610, partial [Verrucomicrobiota bacterium]|nr:hypothetical protein [Verrucomicrobiota bacterium]
MHSLQTVVKCAVLTTIGIAASLQFTQKASAALIAYEGFDYPAATWVTLGNNLNGGIGWSTPWYDFADTNGYNPALANAGVSVIEGGSLTYTDNFGNTLVTSGNKMRNTGTNNPANPFGGGTSSRPWRLMSDHQGAAGTTNWVSFLGVRLPTTQDGNPENPVNIARGANFVLYNFRDYCASDSSVTNVSVPDVQLARDQNGRIGWGRASGANTEANQWWQLISSGSGSQVIRATNESGTLAVPFTNLALIVVRIEHYNDGIPSILNTNADNDTVYAWINPPNIATQPADEDAFAVITQVAPIVAGASPYFNDFAFDCITFFAGNANSSGANPPAEWYGDEIRIGTTYASVVPFIPGSGGVQPGISALQVSGNNVSLTVTGAPSTVYT